MTSHKFYLFLSFFLLWGSIIANGKNLEGHLADMREVFPFAPGNKQIEEIYQLINDYIDQASFPVNGGSRKTRHLDCVMEDPVFAKLGWGLPSNHGYWYHWGFNADIKLYPPLRNKINKAINNPNIKFGVNDANRFWNLLNKDRAARNRYLTSKVYPILGYSTNSISSRMRAQANALVTILYDIHMLGDLIEGKGGNKVKAEPNIIFRECEAAIDNIAGNDSKNFAKAKKLKNKLRAFHGTPSKDPNPSAYLETLKREFSSFILSLGGDPSYNYKNKWEKLGYKMK